VRIHHLNCGTMCPRPSRLVNGTGFLGGGRMVCHCLLVETKDGLLLVDTGIALEDVQARGGRLGTGFSLFANARFDPEETAIRQVVKLGYKADDVRHVVPTHLDLDHASGLVDFPHAAVHVLDREHEAAMKPASFRERHRYLPALWKHGPKWQIHATKGEKWFGFDAIKVADEPEVYLVSMFGHTRGHCAVAVRSGERWLLHCGDAYFSHGEVHAPTRTCPSGLRLFQWIMEMDRTARLGNQDRLRALAKEKPEVTLFSAHCPVELDRLLST
jgi:glyoxylase-like metal-dependent hydrolase (beta-lactamase superfamily II)